MKLVTTIPMNTSTSRSAGRLRRFPVLLAAGACSLLATVASAQIPTMLSYQGRVQMNNTNFGGLGQFKFALVQGVGPSLLWKNDGSPGNTDPAAAVTLPVVNGLVTTTLGETPMAPIPGSVFANPDVRLRVWFNGGPGFQQLAPDQRIVSVGYAAMAGQVLDGSITAGKLAPGVLSPTNFPVNSVGSNQLADAIALGSAAAPGRLDLYRTPVGTPSITVDGTIARISTFGQGGEENLRLGAGGVSAVSQISLLLNTVAGTALAQLDGTASGGSVRTRDNLGRTTSLLEGGVLDLHRGGSDTDRGIRLDGDDGNSGRIQLNFPGNSTRLSLDGHNGTTAEISMSSPAGIETIEILASENGTEGSQMQFRQANGTRTIELDGDVAGAGGGFIRLYKADGSTGLTLQADASGESRITTQVLQITGGSDLSEQFEVNADADADAVQPGMVVCIDPERPGELMPSVRAYDRTVAGIISGAGGVKPGMLMGQAGSVANGRHPVALTGRVYCYADTRAGAIRPGDLLTTSDRPGHAMKVTDHARAQGAILGKAMTALREGQGLVLVLVSLQ